MALALNDEIREYWEDPNTRSLIDHHLRALEEEVVTGYLEPHAELLDVGCGDGSSTLAYAGHAKRCVGVERSQFLLERAKMNLANTALDNVTFLEGDILDLVRFEGQFDVAVTQRVLINLTSWDNQKHAIEQVRSALRPGGIDVMIENTFEGHDVMNAWRGALGMKKISRHWHNLFLHHDVFMRFVQERFQVVAHHTFDVYYLLTRVFANLFASFEGFGASAVKDSIFDQIDAAARQVQQTLGNQVKIGNGPAFGSVQGFVVRKIDNH